MKITKNGFIWKIVTEEAKMIWNNGLYPLYVLYPDDTEALIEDEDTFLDLLAKEFEIGIEVGQITKEMYEKISL